MTEPYYTDEFFTLYNADCEIGMKELPENSIDLIVTDPPYGISFMGKNWDKAVPKVEIWKECLRVLKPGAFAFIMCTPRQDCLARMIVNLQDAGFRTDFTSIFWCFASGFPKAENIGKMVDKQNGIQGEVIGAGHAGSGMNKIKGFGVNTTKGGEPTKDWKVHKVISDLDGSYGGFQPKPSVEIILIVMKPMTEKTFVAQALENGHGITWLDNCRIPTNPQVDDMNRIVNRKPRESITWKDGSGFKNEKNNLTGVRDNGRFPANLLVSDDILNDGTISKSLKGNNRDAIIHNSTRLNNSLYTQVNCEYSDSGSFSRYFSLDAWWDERIKSLPQNIQDTFPFLIIPKASKSEKNIGCEDLDLKEPSQKYGLDAIEGNPKKPAKCTGNELVKNNHPTVKPEKLMAYLVTLGSRPNDLILDPFIGSGTTARACKMLNRKCIGFEIDATQYANIAKHRQDKVQMHLI